MSQISSFRSVIDLWETREAASADIGAGAWAISKWWQRDSIPSEWWAAVIRTERAKSADVSAELLTTLAAREPVEARG